MYTNENNIMTRVSGSARLVALMIFVFAHPSASALSAQATTPRTVALQNSAMDTYLLRLANFGGSGAVMVMRSGRVLYARGFGWADRARRIPMTVETGVDIASMSKDLTAIAILQLEERGLLKRSDSLGKHFDKTPADKREITIEQLITHRSGLPAFFVAGNDFKRLTREQALDSIMATRLEFVPGTGEEYSDAGYVLLAILLEQRTGKSVEAFLEHEQFVPAGLTGTYSYGAEALRGSENIAHGYLGARDAGSAATYVANSDYWVVKGAGGIVSTVLDIARWESALRGRKFIGANSLAVLLGKGDGYSSALAGAPDKFPSGRSGWVRTGAQDFGFAAGAIRYADDSTVVVIALNRQPDDMDISYARNRLLVVMDGFVSGAPPTVPPAGISVPATVSAIAGTYVLPDGSRIMVTRDEQNILVAPDGPLAVELFAYPSDTVGRARRLALSKRVTDILGQLCNGISSPLREAMVRQSERIETFLKSAACGDSTRRVRAIGTIPRWWSQTPTDAPATLVEIASSADTTRIRFEWNGDRIAAVGGGAIVAPVVRFVATRVPTEFAGYHVGIAAPVRLGWGQGAFERDRIVLGSGKTSVIAHRLAASPAR